MSNQTNQLNFRGLASALLGMAERLVPLWLPGGKIEGREYVCASLVGGEGSSCKVNLSDGKWADFAAKGEQGGDLISLYAAIEDLNMGQAARALALEHRLEGVLGIEQGGAQSVSNNGLIPPKADVDHQPEPVQTQTRQKWESMAPVPENTPRPLNFSHWKHGEASTHWEYSFNGELYGYVCRYDRINSKGEAVKEIIPMTWCSNADQTVFKWSQRQWEVPRPLYVARGSFTDKPVVLVEGEKCAKAGHDKLGDLYDFVSWSGGSNAFSKADWGWLKSREVILWPDADCKRFKLSRAEVKTGVDPNNKDIMPLAMQPGYKAMAAIGGLLLADKGCSVRIVDMQDPRKSNYSTPDGWDIADAIEGKGCDVWSVEELKGYIDATKPFIAPDEATNSVAAASRLNVLAGAGSEDDDEAWRNCLLISSSGAVRNVRENVVMALDGWPELDIEGIAEAKGLIAYNEFTNDVMKLRDTPWGTEKGCWSEVDELRLGDWLVRSHRLPSMNRGTLEEAVAIVADRHKFHPVREYLESLEWDGTRRLHTWLRRCCLADGEYDDEDPLQKYLARAGTWFLQGMCARVMEPGCKFDYMLILEGKQGLMKSGLFKVLGGEWFADTGLNLGDKDSLQQLQGRWVYEFSELDQFNKADVTKIKQYIASSSDYFRASYARRAKEYPRQIVFGGTTNESNYLTDPTGNRRFWPLKVTREEVDNAWLGENRAQLLAEAVVRWRKGLRMYPTADEQTVYFEPQQCDRMVENAIESMLISYFYPIENTLDADNQRKMTGLTLVQILGKLGIGPERLQAGRFHEKQAGAALRILGWEQRRSSGPGRPRLWYRPENDSERIAEMQRELNKMSTLDKEFEDSANACPV